MIGAAGGVGSILIQIAKAITGATIIATASRESSQAWVKKLGADYVIDHSKPLQPQIEALGYRSGNAYCQPERYRNLTLKVIPSCWHHSARSP